MPTKPDPAHLSISAMRNEGPFIVEWVAWQRMLGFDRILVATNDCTDGSDSLLDRFAEAGWLTHLRHEPRPGEPPKRSAHRALRAHPLTAAADWAMISDVDEFLVVHLGEGRVQDLTGPGEPDCAGIALHWKCFGSGGHETWEDSPVHRRFTWAAHTHDPVNASFKSLFRSPLRYPRFGAHGPKGEVPDWGALPHDRWVDSAGHALPRWHPARNPQKATSASRVSHANAQLNHYAVRTPEEFALKRGTPSATALVDRYTDDFFLRHDRNETEDTSALDRRSRFDDLHRQAMSLPGVARQHHLACADYARRLALQAGADPDRDARRLHHLDRAANL